MSNPIENNFNPLNQKEERGNVKAANKLWKSVRNILDRQPTEQKPSLGSLILEANKDVSKFGRRPLWKGDYADFMQNNKEIPISIITRQLNGNNDYAFRSVSGNEFENIIASDGIGGDDYKGTFVDDGTLFALDLQAPLAMLDGRTYGGDDDRYRGGYILVVKKEDVLTNVDSPPVQGVVKVIRKIALDKLHTVFRIDRKSPTYETEDDFDYTYAISEIVLKPVK